MAEYRNPVTAEEFETEEAYVDSLINTWNRVQVRKTQLAATEARLVEAVGACCPADKEKGTVRVNGAYDCFKVKKGTRAKYQKERGAPHPLGTVLQQFPKVLKDRIRIQFEESGQKVQTLIDKPESDDEKACVQELLKTRQVVPAKPGIDVEPRKDVERPEEASGVGDLPEIRW